MFRFNLSSLTRALLLLGTVLCFDSGAAEARGGFRGGGVRMGGGARVAASTTFRPGYGVTRSTTVATRYHRPAVYPAVRPYPGVATGIAARSVVRTARRVAYRTAYGSSYYYGPSVSYLPSVCYSTFWEGIAAYNCNGVMYVNTNGLYYPIEGI